MDYNHLLRVYDETNFSELNSDLPFAIFMMKLLSFKIDFRKMSNKSYEEYIKSDNPIKLRYYIQTKLKKEINKCFEQVITENDNEKKELDNLYTHYTTCATYIYFTDEDKEILYDKYIKDNIPEMEKEDFLKLYPPSKMYETIEKIINSKIRDKGIIRTVESEINKQLNKINTRESIYDLLESINDVNRAGLI